jgi:1,4-alpha-glucan branching enzyme
MPSAADHRDATTTSWRPPCPRSARSRLKFPLDVCAVHALIEGVPQLTDHDLKRIVDVDHHDPHHVLGAHQVWTSDRRSGVAVRVFRPDALSVRIVPDDDMIAPSEAKRLHGAGFFEAIFPVTQVFPYRVEVTYAAMKVVQRDAYALSPTVGEIDMHLAAEGKHRDLYHRLGAHPGKVGDVSGVAFAVWAPRARRVSVVGSFNGWDGRLHPMRRMGATGIWELFVPDIGEGAVYKFEILAEDGRRSLKLDPFAFRTETRPETAGIVHGLDHHVWSDGDGAWMEKRQATDPLRRPWSIYEVHLGGFRRVPDERGHGAIDVGGGHTGRWLTYREIAPLLAAHVKKHGFTHVELMPITEYPYDGSWGYQVTGYFAPTSRYGSPDDLRFLIDHLHQAGIGVILDWVPAHFPRDEHGLRRFDGTALYEHLDPRQGEHADWGTMVFNYGRPEVRNFLIASALYWLREFHFDGLRVDAVASMLYLDYSRKHGEWVANVHGGRENLEAIAFLRELIEVVHADQKGAVVIAEESTAWPAVSRPLYVGGLGFTFKWNMGWMHDTLAYFSLDPIHRRHHHAKVTFGLMYAWSENFVLPLSHDEVVHGKGSLIGKMPGDPWQKFANLRALYGYMWAHPGKKLLFMGGELAQEQEWSHERSLDWHLLERADHSGVQALVRDLNRTYREEPALWEADSEPAGFRWLEANDASWNVLVFARFSADGGRCLVSAGNFSPVPRYAYRVGLPRGGRWREVLNTDATGYGGSNVVNGAVEAEETPWHDQPFSAEVTLPPLGVLWLTPEKASS